VDASPRDIRAFRQFFDTYHDPLRRFVYSYIRSWEIAEEIANDAFFELWRHWRSIDMGRGPRAYLYATARHFALNHLRHARVEARYASQQLVQGGAAAEAAPASVEHTLLVRELSAALQRAIDALPPRRREALVLRWKRQLSYEEIGQTLGISAKTVAEHLRLALDQLRHLMAD
jgi:RNA polymerase sigma-70 factor (family 1)